MTRQERRQLSKLRARLSLLLLVCVILSLWIRYLYIEIEDAKFQQDAEISENIDYQDKIQDMSYKIDSLKSIITNLRKDTVVSKPVVKKKTQIKDTSSVLILRKDSLPSDTTSK
jgi:hypothetical protein